MDGGIYLMENDDLIEMIQKPYDDEEVLQRRLAEFPLLLAGEQMNPTKPRRWTLVARETAIPDKDGGSERWSADHLFVDQDAIPTIVEVKRSEDTRIRREVVGQLLDYVAHAAIYWEADLLRERFINTHESAGADPEEVLAELVGEEDVDTFWDHVVSNLRSGKIRLLIVADEIPSELKRIIEFLNEQMEETEVLAVEVAQYVGGEKRAFVPRLIGQTEEAKRTKSRTNRLPRTEDEFLEHVESNVADGTITTEEGDAIRDLYEFIELEADDYDFGGRRMLASPHDGPLSAEATVCLRSNRTG
jgi:DNA-binding ferritin-like protein (Dps family)